MEKKNRFSQNYRGDRRIRNCNSNSQKDTPISKNDNAERIPIDDIDVPQVNEPLPCCSICGQSIKYIAEAISEGDGAFSHFDCVLAKITKENSVKEPDKVSYIGHGTFAIVHPDENGNYSIVARIQYESPEVYNGMKKYMESVRS